jgi:bacterioferritin-associated ferredoxin
VGSNGVAPGQVRRDLAKHHAEQEATLARVIGETVAVHLAQMLGQLLPRMPWRSDCYFCVAQARTLVRDYQVAVQNAQQAGEDVPEAPPPPEVTQAVTWIPVTQLAATPHGPVPVSVSVPACFQHVTVTADMPQPSGLLRADGSPILRR